jgi:pimeloyl-ACP methyl ester carboxylesterase
MAMDKRYTLEAAERFGELEQPALIVWGTGDRFFPLEYGKRLAADIPKARLVEVEGGKAFVSLDRPEEVGDAIESFLRESAAAPAGAG